MFRKHSAKDPQTSGPALTSVLSHFPLALTQCPQLEKVAFLTALLKMGLNL